MYQILRCPVGVLAYRVLAFMCIAFSCMAFSIRPLPKATRTRQPTSCIPNGQEILRLGEPIHRDGIGSRWL